MAQIKKVLCTAMLKPVNREKLERALAPAEVCFILPHEPDAKMKLAKAVKDVDVAIFNGDLDPVILESRELRWVHCCRAGVEKSAIPEIFERGIILTSSSGRSAPALAEHALTLMLALTYDLPGLQRAQQNHRWAATMEYSQRTGMYQKTVGIIGLGKTGQQLARLCKSFDMRVLGYRRSREKPLYVDQVYSSESGETINMLLPECDYVVLCIELNDQTWHCMGKDQFDRMKPSAYLINMGRGGLVVEQDMLEALNSGTIAGAGLDTFEQEPLPEDSPFWDLPNVIITPHITPQLPDREERMLSYVFENIKAYREGGKFVNRVTERDMLTKKHD